MSSKALEPLPRNGVAVEQASDFVFGSNYSKEHKCGVTKEQGSEGPAVPRNEPDSNHVR